MGLMDQILGSAPGIVGQLAKNPQLAQAALSLLSSREGSLGGPGGLAGLVQSFTNSGMGGMMSSWISSGPNPAISADQLQTALGADVIGQVAKKAGISHGDAASGLASMLPSLVDHLSPDGQMPDMSKVEGMLGSLLGSIGG